MGSINTILEGNTTVLSGPNLVSFHQDEPFSQRIESALFAFDDV
jgi:hypothetical protein